MVCVFVNCLFISFWLDYLVGWLWLYWLLLCVCCGFAITGLWIGGLCSLIVLLCAILCSLYFVVLICLFLLVSVCALGLGGWLWLLLVCCLLDVVLVFVLLLG